MSKKLNELKTYELLIGSGVLPLAHATRVFIDETGMHLGLTRLYGRAPKGERLYDTESPGNRGQNISLIGGMSIDGLIARSLLDGRFRPRSFATLSVVGSVNTSVFLFDVQEILILQLWVGAIVVMDNLPVHHAHVVREAFEEKGAKLVFLPPYSPDLWPIELCWSFSSNFCVQRRLERAKHLGLALTNIINECISADDALNWFAHYGLFI